jgi:glycosyltransferase involved in cell wall biosynthesis
MLSFQCTESMKYKPLISVLMTAYNRERYIGEAIESVLSSTYQGFELIIVDDFSVDSTVQIALSYASKDKRIKVYVNECNIGDYANRNKAASYAKGKYIKYLDSDDIIYPHGLEVMVNSMEKFPGAGYGVSSKDTKGPLPILLSPRESFIENFFGSYHFDRAPGSVIINREVFNSVGGFSGKRMIGDYELWMKISLYYNTVIMPMYLYWARNHDNQESKTKFADDYKELRSDILDGILALEDCPLTKEEKKEVLNKIRRKEKLNWVLSLVRKFI